MDSVMHYLLQRRSVRAFDGRPVEPELIHCLLEAAMAAPSACNGRPWEFVVTTDDAIIEQLRKANHNARYNAPCAIVVCGNPAVASSAASQRFWPQDCSAAMENLLVAAAGLGLGAVWVGTYPIPRLEKFVREIFHLPKEVFPLGVALVGYPASGAVPEPRTQYDEQRVHWQLYEGQRSPSRLKRKFGEKRSTE